MKALKYSTYESTIPHKKYCLKGIFSLDNQADNQMILNQ